MRLDVDSAQPSSVVNPNIPFNSGISGPQEYLRSGIDAAQSGDKTTARAMFLRASELNPNEPNVWLWLASISEYPEELMGFVEKVLDIDPFNERAVQWRTATCALLAKTFVQRGSDAAEADQPMYAEDCFEKALQYDPRNTSAMMWLASLTSDEDVRRRHLDRIIELEPEHQAAKNALCNIAIERERAEFAEVRRVASDGDVSSAVALLGGFTAAYPQNLDSWMLLSHLSSEPDVKMSALARVLVLDPEHQVAKASLNSLVSLFGESKVSQPEVDREISSTIVEFVETVEAPEAPTEEMPIAPPIEQLAVDFSSDPEESVEESAPIAATVEELVFKSDEPETLDDAEDVEVAELKSAEVDAEDDWDRKTEAYSSEDFQVSEFLPGPTIVYEEPSSIPMPEADLSEETIQPERTGFETVVEARSEIEPPSSFGCPYCSAANDTPAFSCRSCFAVLTLADLESLIDNKNADTYLIRRAVESMESDRVSRDFSEVELTTLGIGHLNLRNLQFGFDVLQEASKLNPDNIVLSSHVNSLLIRMDEIRRQDEVHATMVSGKKILVVDDSPTIQKLIAGKLEKSGHEVFLSNDGLEALEQIKTLTPDLVLLDITMPNMDGYEACRQIRGRVSTANVPVVMISGKDGFFDKMRGRMAGAAGHITKPFGPETLMKAVEFYLGGGNDMMDVERDRDVGVEADFEEVEVEEQELALAD